MVTLKIRIAFYAAVVTAIFMVARADAQTDSLKENIYPVKKLKPKDSATVLKVGDRAPDFTLPSVHRGEVSLSQYLGKKNVVISFVPAAWTPVCSDQWPGYNIAKALFDENNAVLLGITVDNVPTLYAWTRQMCEGGGRLWFPVLSDFNPHGEVARKYGVLRSDGQSERALFVIDTKGTIRYIDVHDINERPDLKTIAEKLKEISKTVPEATAAAR
jgi:peroxiredoxin